VVVTGDASIPDTNKGFWFDGGRVATVTAEVVLATALTFAALFSDLSAVPGLIQSSYPSSEWMDVCCAQRP